MPDEKTHEPQTDDAMSQSEETVDSQEGDHTPGGEIPDEALQNPAVQAKLQELAAKEARLEQAGVNYDVIMRVANSPEFDTFMTLIEQGRFGEVKALLNRESSTSAGEPIEDDVDDDTPDWARKLTKRLDVMEQVVVDRQRTEAQAQISAFKKDHQVSDDELRAMVPHVKRGSTLEEALNTVRAPSLAQKNRELSERLAKLTEQGKLNGTVEGAESPANESGASPSDGRRLSIEDSISSALASHGHS